MKEDFFNSELAKQIWEKKYRFQNETFDEWLDRVSNKDKNIRRLIEEKKFIFGGRILSNRGLIGSNSNCYTSGRVGDSLEDIMTTAKNIALTFKAQGGQGISLSLIRPKDTSIKGRYTSDGIVPFMEIFDNVAANISQGGSRRGALLMSLDITHREAATFITIKSDLKKINNANLSLEIDDRFMNAVKEYYQTGQEITFVMQKSYGENNEQQVEYEINPVKLYKLMCKYAHAYAEPGVLFMDKIRNYNLMSEDTDYRIDCCNPCGEQPLNTNGACLLSAINLAKYVVDPFTSNTRFDFYELSKDLPYIYQAMNDVLDEGVNKHALPEQQESARNWRNIGISITGLAELFIMFQTPYGSERSVDLTKQIISWISLQCLKLNIKMGVKYGSFPKFKTDVNYNRAKFVRNLARTMRKVPTIKALRNCSMLTIAPTGSISNLIGASSMGIEPMFAFSYKRRTVSLNGEETVYTVYPEIVEKYLASHPKDSIDNLPYYFVSAYDIDWKARIDVQAAAQEFIDSAISATVNLPADTTIEEVEELYLYAWEKGLKGVTIYRDGSRDPILFTDTSKTPVNAPISSNNAIKRPKILKARLTVNKAKNESYAVIVGLLNDKPYEIFAFEMPKDSQIKACDGELVKVKKGQYSFKSEYFNIDNLQLATDKLEERALTILCSMMLRHNIDIKYIIKTAKKVNPIISSFSSVVCRVLGTYMKAEVDPKSTCPECGAPLVKEGGCEHCSECHYSKCNLLISKHQ